MRAADPGSSSTALELLAVRNGLATLQAEVQAKLEGLGRQDAWKWADDETTNSSSAVVADMEGAAAVSSSSQLRGVLHFSLELGKEIAEEGSILGLPSSISGLPAKTTSRKGLLEGLPEAECFDLNARQHPGDTFQQLRDWARRLRVAELTISGQLLSSAERRRIFNFLQDICEKRIWSAQGRQQLSTFLAIGTWTRDQVVDVCKVREKYLMSSPICANRGVKTEDPGQCTKFETQSHCPPAVPSTSSDLSCCSTTDAESVSNQTEQRKVYSPDAEGASSQIEQRKVHLPHSPPSCHRPVRSSRSTRHYTLASPSSNIPSQSHPDPIQAYPIDARNPSFCPPRYSYSTASFKPSTLAPTAQPVVIWQSAAGGS